MPEWTAKGSSGQWFDGLRRVTMQGPTLRLDRPLDAKHMTIEAGMADAGALYARKGFGGRIGFGARPALVVIDLVNGWTTPDSPLGAAHDAVIDNTNVLLAAFRDAELPIFFSTMAYEPHLQDAGLLPLKVPALRDPILGTRAAELDPRLELLSGETLLVKKFFSCFPGTPLQSTLTSLGVDTVVIAGCSTSACVRATSTDALCLGFRPIVVREAVGDRAAGPHEWNLFDIDAKFGDVESLQATLEYVRNLTGSVA